MSDFSFIHSPGMPREEFEKKIKEYIEYRGTAKITLATILKAAEEIRKRDLDADDTSNPVVP